ncbi:MAG TPA: F0F1 ATP synthase subunit epsilon, partial [Gammaproteobacteria bacterium]|nr:F0F1 ATP synthase subunit epsilon [Gammaproteobacteria bacterium]
MATDAPADGERIRLRLLAPTRTVLDEEVAKVLAEAPNGEFCLLPRHVDFVTALVPGVLSYSTVEGNEYHAAVNGGVLVKQGRTVSVSSEEIITGDDLTELEGRVQQEFRTLGEHERTARSVVARLEAGILRRFTDMEAG